MNRLEELRADLQTLLAQTAGAEDDVPAPVAFVGGADERRVLDDLAAGRVAFRSANQAARLGIEALDRTDRAKVALSGDVAELTVEEIGRLGDDIREGKGLATAALDHGRALLTASLAVAAGPKGLAALRTPAKRRGRERLGGDWNRRLAEAVDRQEALGLEAKEARAAALKADPELGDVFAGASDRTLRRAVDAGR